MNDVNFAVDLNKKRVFVFAGTNVDDGDIWKRFLSLWNNSPICWAANYEVPMGPDIESLDGWTIRRSETMLMSTAIDRLDVGASMQAKPDFDCPDFPGMCECPGGRHMLDIPAFLKRQEIPSDRKPSPPILTPIQSDDDTT